MTRSGQTGRIFAGREREMAGLSAAMDAAIAGHGRVVMLAENQASGRPGWPKNWPPMPNCWALGGGGGVIRNPEKGAPPRSPPKHSFRGPPPPRTGGESRGGLLPPARSRAGRIPTPNPGLPPGNCSHHEQNRSDFGRIEMHQGKPSRWSYKMAQSKFTMSTSNPEIF